MSQHFYQLFETVTYPCYWLSANGELWMNNGAKAAASPLSDHDIMRRMLKTAGKITGYVDNAPFAMPMLSDALHHQSLTLIPLPDGVFATAFNILESPMAAFSNQMREPLTNIFAILPLLNKRLEDADSPYVEEIQENCYDLLRLTSNLENIGRLEGQRLSLRSVDLSTLIESIGFSAESVCKNRGVTIQTIIPDYAVPVEAEPHLLSESILNLVRNSLQYTRDGNVITIRLSVIRGKAVVTVADKGIGIKPEFIEFIFEPYFSTDPYGDEEPNPGLGIGLSVVREAVKYFGGTLTAESRFGEGTKISFSLPLCEADDGVLGSDPADYLLNRFSPVYVQLSGICRLPAL